MEEATLVIMVTARYDPEEKVFSHLVPQALREYADAVDHGNISTYAKETDDKPRMGRSDMESLTTSNGCLVKVIAGFQNSQR